MDSLSRLEIESECRRLVLHSAALADAGDADTLAALFDIRGTLRRPNGDLLEGRVAIRAAYAQRSADRITRHLVANTLVEVEGPDQARARSLLLLWIGSARDAVGPQGRPARGGQVVGEFDDVLTRDEGGWRILRRAASFVLHAPDCG